MINKWDIKWRLFDWKRPSMLKIVGPDHNGDYAVNDQGTIWVVYSDGTRDIAEGTWEEIKRASKLSGADYVTDEDGSNPRHVGTGEPLEL